MAAGSGRKNQAIVRETVFVLVAMLVSLWSAWYPQLRADSASQSVQVSVIVENSSSGGTSGGSSGGGGGTPQGGRRSESILLRIASQTFTEQFDERDSVVRVRNSDGTSLIIFRSSAEAETAPADAAPDVPQHSAPPLPAVGRYDESEPCTLLDVGCIAFGFSADMYRFARALGLWAGAVTGNVHVSEPVLWLLILLWIVVGARLLYVLGLGSWRHLHPPQEAYGTTSNGAPVRHFNAWQFLTVAIVLSILLYGLLAVLEMSRAQVTVGLTVANYGISLSCDSSVALGTITDTGDTGVYVSSRATSCSVTTGNAAGYSLQWQITTGSGGTNTGYLISQNEHVITPYTPAVAGTPETWSVSAGASEWGGRLSSTSTTFSSATWGPDGSNQKWLNISTGATVIANRTSATNGSDTENIGFRAEIGSQATQPAGTYKATVVFTAITN